ncbi:kelch-like protein 28 isoform X1 [Branchiostoma floridae]|uniref:Kelch-like protein 28 isoform X1 n=2 Tax=Branchiostoma floridae TaxID=7739 RepID=A0A9J7MYD0_BRAFL|nr:kelch-like protein 28 isoform X1 [Branchiostoma floridae]
MFCTESFSLWEGSTAWLSENIPGRCADLLVHAKMDSLSGGTVGTSTYSEQLLHGLNELRQRQELCDVVLRVGERKFHVHRVVLASCSPYFKAMFTGNLCERDQDEVEFHCIDETAMMLLIDFAYTGTVAVTDANVQMLLPAASLFQIEQVIRQCCDFLQSALHPHNCIGVARFAQLHACFKLYTQAYNYICRHFEDVSKSEEFFLLTASEILDLLSNDNLNVVSEESVFEAVERWIYFDYANRRCYLSKLLRCIRLPLLPVKFLTRCYEANPLVREDPTAQHLLNDALKYHLVPELRLRSLDDDDTEQQTTARPRCPPKVLCAVGGKNGLFATLNSVEVYFPESNTWTEVSPLNHQRYNCATAVADNRLFVFGGITCIPQNGETHHIHSNSVSCWDPTTNSWTSIAPMNHCRSSLTVTVHGGYIYALGGYNGERYLSTVERYSPRTNSWEEMSHMLKPRSCFAAAAANGAIFAIGGYGPTHLDSVERYNPTEDSWEFVAPMADKRINFGVGVTHGYLFVVGGHNGMQHLNTIERYDPYSDQWASCTPMETPSTGLGVAVLNGHLYVAGGHSGSSYLQQVLQYDPVEDSWAPGPSMNVARCNFGLAAL